MLKEYPKTLVNKTQNFMMRFIIDLHRNDRRAKGINSTFITLISKVDSPQQLGDFRSIFFDRCMYKFLAEVLV